MIKRPPRKDFLVFGAPAIEDAEIQEVVASMRSGWLGTGPKVARFEQDFARYVGAPYAAALGSCTAALHLSLLAAGVGPGDEVVTTPLTFAATVNSIIHTGATPVLADVDPTSMNIAPDRVYQALTSRTKAILPVHFAGRPCAMDDLMGIAEERNLTVIEDCAHAIETEYRGQKAGTFGAFGCFSFYVTKNVATGEGGMVVAKDEATINRIKVLGLHGMSKDAWKRYSDEGFKHYQVVAAGFKYNMMDLQAAIGIHQLARVEANWKRREAIWARYMDAFEELPVTLPAPVEPDTRHAYHLYTLRLDEARTGVSRDAFLDAMTKRNIGVGVHYRSLQTHPYYRDTFGWRPHDYPHAYQIGEETVSLPLSAGMSDEDVDDVIAAVRSSLAG